MRKPFTCDHPDDRVQLRKRTVGGGGMRLGNQCLVCGGLVGLWVKLERVPNWRELPEWDHKIEDMWQASERVYMHEYREWRVQQDGVAAFATQPKPEPQRGDFWEKYAEYLRTPGWRARRELVLKRAGGICEGCGINPATQVHHLTYERVGKEMLFDLVAICDFCHDIVHGKA